jgi:hypothetical protein
MNHITLKDGKPSVIYKFTKDEPGAYVQGVAARDLTDEDLAAYSPGQRFAIDLESKRKDGAYKKVGTVPRALSAEAIDPETVPAATSGEKDS